MSMCCVCQRTKGGCTFSYYNCTRGWDSNAIKPVTIAWPWTAVAHIVPFPFALLSLSPFTLPLPAPPTTSPLHFLPVLSSSPPASFNVSFSALHRPPRIINKSRSLRRVHRNRGKERGFREYSPLPDDRATKNMLAVGDGCAKRFTLPDILI